MSANTNRCPSELPSAEPGRLFLREFGTLLVTRDQGEPIRAELLRRIEDNDVLVVDFDGVEATTPSFVDELLGKCLEAIGPSEFRRRVKLIGASSDVRRLANLVLSNRSASWRTRSERG